MSLAEPSDAEAIGGIFFPAFHDQAYFRTMCPDTPLARKCWTEHCLYCINDAKQTIVLKVTDATTGKIVGFGRWVKPKAEGQVGMPAEEEGRYSEEFFAQCDERTAGPLFGAFHKHRESMMGDRKHWYMELLGTAEAYKGKGAGSMILEFGCDLADKDGLECYIDASPRGKPVYEKFGFVFTEVEQLPMDYYYNFGIRQPKGRQ